MNPTFWLVMFIISLAVECVLMNLVAASFAPGALVAAIMCFFDLPAWSEVIAFGAVTAVFIVVVRPILAKYLNRHKKQARLDRLIGHDAVVICEIDNAHGVGVVNISGREYKARSHRPNAVISEGSIVKVVEMKGYVAIVDDLKRRSTGRIIVPDDDGFLDDYED